MRDGAYARLRLFIAPEGGTPDTGERWGSRIAERQSAIDGGLAAVGKNNWRCVLARYRGL
jgi:hypothetical protein